MMIVIFLQNSTQGSLLLGAISYGKLSNGGQEVGKNPQKNPVSYQLSYIVPPNKVEKHAVMNFFLVSLVMV
jgi:tripeptidyl-peptidase-2